MPGATAPTGRFETQALLMRVALPWYFLEYPRAMVGKYLTYARVFGEVFSFVFLLRTLLSPWKNIHDSYPTRGFNLNLILQTLTFNVITRGIGAIVRLGAIVMGLFVQVALFVGFAAYIAIWMLFPIVFLWGLLVLIGIL